MKVGTAEVASSLLAALRDENEDVRRLAAWALGEVSKNRKLKLPQELIVQATNTLRYMLDDPRNLEKIGLHYVGESYYSRSVDAIWEALWLVCQRMDEQRG
jgi:hypothetical protein